jgi:hypothetical protein
MLLVGRVAFRKDVLAGRVPSFFLNATLLVEGSFDAEYRFCEDWLRKPSWKHCRDCLFDSWKKPKSQFDPCHFPRIYMLLTFPHLLTT